MDYSFGAIFEFERGATREMSSLASGQHDLTEDVLGAGRSRRDVYGLDFVGASIHGYGSSRESEEPLLHRSLS